MMQVLYRELMKNSRDTRLADISEIKRLKESWREEGNESEGERGRKLRG
jgi:hypothetical protein